MSENQTHVAGSGIGLCGTLFLVFVVLRLTDHIDWTWYWVASPLWVPWAVMLGGFLIGAVLYFVIGLPIAWLLDRYVRPRRRARDRAKWEAYRQNKGRTGV